MGYAVHPLRQHLVAAFSHPGGMHTQLLGGKHVLIPGVAHVHGALRYGIQSLQSGEKRLGVRLGSQQLSSGNRYRKVGRQWLALKVNIAVGNRR